MNPSGTEDESPDSVNPEQWGSLPPERLLEQVQAALDNRDSPLWTAPERLRSAVPNIIPLLPRIEPPYHRYDVIHAIGQISPDAVHAILHTLKEAMCWYRNCYVGEALARIGRPAVPALIEGLCDPDSRIRNIAGWALRTMRLTLPPSATALLRPLARIAPNPWPGKPLTVQPGDLSTFFLQEGPARTLHPFSNAPVFEERGGLMYFGAQPGQDEFRTVLRLLHIDGDHTDYAVFVDASGDPVHDRYLIQIRTIRVWALKRLFLVYPDAADPSLTHQDRTLNDLLWAFIGHQQGYWGTLFADPRAPAGTLDGDGEYAREELAFGIMKEGPGICRLWSRAILVEK